MEFEKIMDPFILFSKKRYACVVWTNPNKHDYIDYKGIQVVRRDNCPYVKERSMEIFQKILLDKDIPKSIKCSKYNISDIKEFPKDLSVEDILVRSSNVGTLLILSLIHI